MTEEDKQRFLLELEFINALASPAYINWLAQSRLFEDKAFISYLQYLQYWKAPEYSKYIVYPHSLFFLDMLQSKQFRTSMASMEVEAHVEMQQFHFWQHYRHNRVVQAQAASADKQVTQ